MPALNPMHAAVYDLATVAPANPGANTQLDWACPDNARVHILQLTYLFTTDANAANRNHIIEAVSGGVNQPVAASTVNHTASLAWRITYPMGLPAEVDLTASTYLLIPFPTGIILEPGDSIETNIQNMQAGDAITAIVIRYKQWVIA